MGLREREREREERRENERLIYIYIYTQIDRERNRPRPATSTDHHRPRDPRECIHRDARGLSTDLFYHMGSGHRAAVLLYRLTHMHNTVLSAARVARVSPSLLRVADLCLSTLCL